MANKIKLGADGSEQNSIFKGQWALDVTPSNTGGGPTASTGFFNGPNIPVGGYAIYHDGSCFIANDDTDLLGRIGDLGGPISSVISAMDWVALQEEIMVVNGNIDNTVRDGILLDLDMNNPTSFMTSTPTTNIVSNWNLNTGWSKGYQGDIEFDQIPPPAGIDAPTVGFNKRSTSSYWYSYGDYAGPQIPGSVYTVSMYVKTVDPSFSINFYTANNSETGRHWSGHISVPSDNEWHRIVWPSFTVAANSQSDSLSFNFRMGGTSAHNNSRTWFCAPQMELGTEATPFVKGTRTESTVIHSLGHSGVHNRTHGILNAPEFSNGGITLNETQGFQLPTLEGINDHANATVVLWYKTKDTQELWVKGPSGSYYIGACHPTSNYYHQGSGSPTYYIDGIQRSHPKDHKDGEFHMFEAKNVDFRAWNQFNWFLYGSSWNMNGTVAKIMVYDRALTSAESLQNYYGTSIVTDSIRYMWDAGNLVSYEEGSTQTRNLSGTINGTLTNSVGFNKANGGYWEFDGADDHILLENSLYSFYLRQGDAWTVNAWIKTTTTVAGFNEGGILSNSNGGPVYSNFQVYNGHIGFTHYNGSWQTSQGTAKVNDGRWHQLTWANLGNGTMDLYVDGNFDSNVDSRLSSSNAIDVIGRSWTGNSFAGAIGNVQINLITMNADQAKQNFNAQRNRFDI